MELSSFFLSSVLADVYLDPCGEVDSEDSELKDRDLIQEVGR